jgi:membrane-bound metal-dependent hydrolase YbcI (DUF457 family)
MDTITHGIVGALAGKALFAGGDVPAALLRSDRPRAISDATARAAIIGCTLGAVFPDIDVFAGPLARNPLAIMEWHRNITHSVVMLPLWALLLSALSLPLFHLLRWKSPPFWKLCGIFAAGIGTHIFLDLVTNFGTMVWSPLRFSRPAWDWIFIVDFTLTGIALVPQLAAWCYREPAKFWASAAAIWALLTTGVIAVFVLARATGYGFSRVTVGAVAALLAGILFLPAMNDAGFRWTRAKWCRAGLAGLCLYIFLAAAAHGKALADVKRFAASQHLEVESIAALPLPPTLTHWVGLISTREGVWRETFHEPRGVIEHTQLYSDEQSVQLIAQARQLPDVQVYLWFARYPVWRVVEHDREITRIDVSDVRFFREQNPYAADDPSGSSGLARVRQRRTVFTFEIVFDAQGHVISHGFKEPE